VNSPTTNYKDQDGHILKMRDFEGQTRVDEQEIPGDGADRRRQQGRAATDIDGDQQDGHQFGQPNDLVADPGQIFEQDQVERRRERHDPHCPLHSLSRSNGGTSVD
jgi:hypothetical protein